MALDRLKNFLFETEEQESDMSDIDIDALLAESSEEEEAVKEVEVTNTALDGLIDNIYAENDLVDKNHSIFKVKEAIAALPEAMPKVQKLESVISILKISGLNEEVVLNDASERVKTLLGAKQNINGKNEKHICSLTDQINILSSDIASLQEEIYETKTEDEKSTKMIDEEIASIKTLTDFLRKDGEVRS